VFNSAPHPVQSKGQNGVRSRRTTDIRSGRRRHESAFCGLSVTAFTARGTHDRRDACLAAKTNQTATSDKRWLSLPVAQMNFGNFVKLINSRRQYTSDS